MWFIFNFAKLHSIFNWLYAILSLTFATLLTIIRICETPTEYLSNVKIRISHLLTDLHSVMTLLEKDNHCASLNSDCDLNKVKTHVLFIVRQGVFHFQENR